MSAATTKHVTESIRAPLVQGLAFVVQARVEAAPLIEKALKIKPAGAATSAAIELKRVLAAAEALIRDTTKAANKIAADETSRPELLREQGRDLRSNYSEQTRRTRTVLNDLTAQLEDALAERALPRSGSDSAAALAREEIGLALESVQGSDAKTRVATELAAGGGEIAAQLASSWGKLRTQKDGVLPEFYHRVRNAAILAAKNSDDEDARTAAEALEGINGVKGAVVIATSGLSMAERYSFRADWPAPVQGIE